MPELPDIEAYLAALRPRLCDSALTKIQVRSPFLLRSVEPKLSEFEGRKVLSVERLGKRIVIGFEGEYFLVLHLMISGRLKWSAPDAPLDKSRNSLAYFSFGAGTLTLTEAAKEKRASLHAAHGAANLDQFRRSGLDVLTCSLSEFVQRLKSENRTLKRALTNPDWFDGIGNAFSDEILHEARLSPLRLTSSLKDEECERLLAACRKVLTDWTKQLVAKAEKSFPRPADVTAFRPGFAVHGKFGEPCPVCGTKVQRIRYASNETNYCPRCQNEGRLLADRALSRLLKSDWPRTVEELEAE